MADELHYDKQWDEEKNVGKFKHWRADTHSIHRNSNSAYSHYTQAHKGSIAARLLLIAPQPAGLLPCGWMRVVTPVVCTVRPQSYLARGGRTRTTEFSSPPQPPHGILPGRCMHTASMTQIHRTQFVW